MKTLSIICTMALAAVAAQAAPVITQKDISEEALKKVANERQVKSMEEYEQAVKKAQQAREDAEKAAAKHTQRNDEGLKQTIIKSRLNAMLPPCERAPEEPREDDGLNVEY
ncbi:MAG: hypothetical protein ACI4OZ_01750 [Akkermansia sp.]|nr:hypothetical protein [Akkermansia muciniphila]MDD6812771.1 hypothetical protein [Akkermansia muciniphila]